MIEVSADIIPRFDGADLLIRAAGHANYDVSGRDIVCASVSTVMQCVCALLEDHYPTTDSRGEGGYIEVSVILPCYSIATEALDLIRPLLDVVADLAAEYPKNVSYHMVTTATAV